MPTPSLAPYRCAPFGCTSLAGIDLFGSPLVSRAAAFAPRKLPLPLA